MTPRFGSRSDRDCRERERWDGAGSDDLCRRLEEHLRSWKVAEPGLIESLRTTVDLTRCIAAGLRDTRATGDWDMFECYLIAAGVHPSRTYTDLLCEVLDERRDDMNSEAVVDALDPIADPAATQCLRRAVTWIPDWDEYGQLARKAVYALQRIGTPEAIDAIRQQVTAELPFKVVEAAADVPGPRAGCLDRLTRLVPPPVSSGGRPDWERAEEAFGATFPADYKQLVAVYGAGTLDGFMSILEPLHENRHLDLLRQRDVQLEALRTLRAGGEAVPFDVDAGHEEIAPWAMTDNGDVVYWVCRPRRSPDEWQVAVNEARGPDWETFEGSATEFLAAVLSQERRLRVCPDDFPSHSPRFAPA